MKVELFIHGVPKGSDYSGLKEEKAFFDNFYLPDKENNEFQIQVREFGGRLYCYYHYLIYNNVVDCEGRAGSYLGISLRLDAYCKDFFNMYRILDCAYNIYCTNLLVKLEGNKVKYLISDFSSVEKQIKELEENNIFSMLQKAFTADSFTSLDKSFISKEPKSVNCNLYDCTQENVVESIKRYGKITISPYYPSRRENEIEQICNNKVQSIQQNYNNQLKEKDETENKNREALNTNIASVRKDLELKRTELAQKERDIKQRDEKIKSLENELNTIERGKKISLLISEIDRPIAQLIAELKGFTTTQNYGNSENSESDIEGASLVGENLHGKIDQKDDSKVDFKTIGIIASVLISIAIISCLVWYIYFNKTRKEPTDKIADCIETPSNLETSIDIKEYNGSGSLKRNSCYTVEAKNCNTISWLITGGEMEKTEDPKIIKITPKDDSLKIELYISNIPITHRKLDVE